MNTAFDLVRAIRADPSCDTVRLAFADWLEEHDGETVRCPACLGTSGAGFGKYRRGTGTYPCSECNSHGTVPVFAHAAARAQLIRVQCRRSLLEAEHGGRHKDHPKVGGNCALCEELDVLERRERELLTAHWHDWIVRVNRAPSYCENILTGRSEVSYEGGVRHLFDRGFVTSVRLPLRTFEANAGRLFLDSPIERVVLTDRQPVPVPMVQRTGTTTRDVWFWEWQCASGRTTENGLSAAIMDRVFELVPRSRRRRDRHRRSTRCYFLSAKSALEAASQVCVAIGRAEALNLEEV